MSKLPILAALLAAVVSVVPASAATFLFVRHAESTVNAGTFSSVAEFYDPPLTTLGQQQAQALATTLGGYNVTSIYTSAYQRTQLTIAPTAALFGITPIADARTNEWYVGDLQNLSQLSNVASVIGAWASGNTAAKANLPNAESLNDLAARVLPAWEDILNAHANDNGVVLVVGHGAETGFVMPYFAANVSLQFAFAHPLTNTGILELEIINGTPYVTNWQGIALPTPAAVPEPASGLLFAGALALLGRSRLRHRQPDRA